MEKVMNAEIEIDHIIPMCSLDLTKEENLIKVCHYTNLRPLWKSENSSKGSEDKKFKFRHESSKGLVDQDSSYQASELPPRNLQPPVDEFLL